MILKKIIALKDLTLNTNIETVYLFEGEIRTVKFKNLQQYEALLAFDNFKDAYDKIPVVKKVEEVIELRSAKEKVEETTEIDEPDSVEKVEETTEIDVKKPVEKSAKKVVKKSQKKPENKTVKKSEKKSDKTPVGKDEELECFCPNCDTKMIKNGDNYICPVCGN